MIDSSTQLVVTLAQVARFTEAIEAHGRSTRPENIDPILWTAERDGLVSVCRELLEEATSYINRVIAGGK
jgi:hypothetical protein